MRSGSVEDVRELIANGASFDWDRKYEQGRTLLHIAICRESLEMVRLLIEHGVDVNELDGFRDGPLSYATRTKKCCIVRALIQAGANVNVDPVMESVPLYTAISYTNNLGVVYVLLDSGADPNATHREGHPVLSLAAHAGNSDAVRALITGGAKVDGCDRYGNQAIHTAARFGQADAVRALAEAGADVNVANASNKGKRPLHYAAKWGHMATVRALLDSGANPDAADMAGRVPWDYAAGHRRDDVANMLRPA